MADPTTTNDNVLASVKEALGIPVSVSSFDTTLLMHINAVISILGTLGVGEGDPLAVNSDTVWTDCFEDSTELDLVKTDMYLRVRLMFDPPNTSFVLESINKQITEIEWRLNVIVDSGESTEEG